MPFGPYLAAAGFVALVWGEPLLTRRTLPAALQLEPGREQDADERHPVRTRDWSIYRVGLTGGIASGKSTVADLFAALGVPVIDTDLIARDVVAPGTPGLTAVIAAFGAGGAAGGRQPRPPPPAGTGLRHGRPAPATGGDPAPPDPGADGGRSAPAPAVPTRSW